MIDNPAMSNQLLAQSATNQGQTTLHMQSHDRMGGSMPAWKTPASAQDNALGRLENAANGRPSFADELTAQQLNALEPGAGSNVSAAPQEFTFGDVVDMVNPLHHIPVVGSLYRGMTGDEIRPAARLIGGTVFGGPVGAASGMVNLIAEAETGKDLAGNALGMIADGDGEARYSGSDPESRLNQAYVAIEQAGSPLPPSMMAFANNGAGRGPITTLDNAPSSFDNQRPADMHHSYNHEQPQGDFYFRGSLY